MKPKEYLMQALRLKRKYQNALEDLEYIRNMASGVTAIRYDKDQIQTSPRNDQMALYMVRLETAENKALRLSEEYFSKYEQIRMYIDMMSPQLYADVLYLRYIQGEKLWQIADELNYDYDYIRSIHGKALHEFGEVFPEALQ